MSNDNHNCEMAFAFLPAGRFLDSPFSHSLTYSLGAAYIIAYLRQHGFSTEQVVSTHSLNINDCARIIMERKPKVVGLTVYFTNYEASVLLAKTIKKIDPRIILVFGGPTPSIQAEAILEHVEEVDICVRHEGEDVCLALLTGLKSVFFNLDCDILSSIDNISYRKDGKVVSTPDASVFIANRGIKDYLDKYPSPYLSGVLPSSHGYQAGILTTRGCNQHCTYCNCSVLSHRSFLTHSIERVTDELAYISKAGVPAGEAVQIFDDAFTLIPDRAAMICERILERGIQIPLRCITRCDKIDKELLKLMKRAGFIAIGFSLESASPRVLRAIGKLQRPDTLSDPDFNREMQFIELFKENVTHARELGLFTFASIMIGLPGETLEEGTQTIDLIRSMNFPLYMHNVLKIYPGTPLELDHQRHGLSIKATSNDIEYVTKNPYDVTRIELAPGSDVQRQAFAERKFDVELLALVSKESSIGDFCQNVIIESDEAIPMSVISWMQENLAINGRVIQIFSTQENMMRYLLKDKDDVGRSLMRDLQPFLFSCYYRQADSRYPLKSMHNLIWGERCNTPIYMHNGGYNMGLQQNSDIFSSVVLDITPADPSETPKFLSEISDKSQFGSTFDLPLIPYNAALCRWDSVTPNCVTLSTLIINSDLDIKTCWGSMPIGKVGTPFALLKKTVASLLMQKRETRSCSSCEVNEKCNCCIWPGSIAESDFCSWRRNPAVETGANTARYLQNLNTLLL